MTSPARRKKLLQKIRDKRCKNVSFEELRTLVEAYDCELKNTPGSHHMYVHPALSRRIVLQKPHGSDVPKPFCWQVLKAIQRIIDYCEEEGYDA